MKNQTIPYFPQFGKSLVVAIAIILLSEISTTKAQNSLPKIPNSVFNGLFSPNAAQRFFETGREDFEREIKFVGNSASYFNGNLLQIDEKLIQQIQKNRTFQNFTPDFFFNPSGNSRRV
jgi:hypothetical protein